MTFTSSQQPLSNVRILQGSTPTTAKVDMPVSGTEYSYTFPQNTRRFRIVSETCADLKVGTAAGNIAADNYWPVSAGSELSEEFLNLSGLTLYFTSNKDNDVVRVLSWG